MSVFGNNNEQDLNQHVDFPLGAVVLDLEENELTGIAAQVVDRMVACDQIPADQRDNVIKVLLLRHRHVNDSSAGSFRRSSTRSSSRSALTINSSDEKLNDKTGGGETKGGDGGGDGGGGGGPRLAAKKSSGFTNFFHVNSFGSFRRSSSAEDTTNAINLTHTKSAPTINGDVEKAIPNNDSYTQIDMENGDLGQGKKSNLMKKIPDGAEATAVLVGAVGFLKQPTIAFVRLAEGVMMDNILEVPIPVRFMFILLGPFNGDMDYHEVGRSISTLMSDPGFHEIAYKAHSRGQLLAAINEFLTASIVLPPSDWDNKNLVPIDDIRVKAQEMNKRTESIRAKRKQAEAAAVTQIVQAPTAAAAGGGGGKPPRDPLTKKGGLFRGLIEDVTTRYPQYWSDIKDGIDGQVLAATIFIYFAALSAAITFGGMYGDQMDNLIGVGETLLISAVNGIIFAVFACQPLLIVGATGPLMIFDVSLYTFCISYGVEFLPMRFWIGFWMTITGLLIAAFEGVVIVKKITRFTEEIFSTLVCVIFIYQSFAKLFDIYKEHPLQSEYCFEDANHTEIVNGTIINGTLYNGTYFDGTEVTEPILLPQPNTSLLSTILMIGTFLIAFKLKHFRNSKFLGRSIRRALGDFGVPISIVLMVTADYLIQDTYTDKLDMPDGLQPSNAEVRGWVINPLGNQKPFPVWCIFAAAPASLLLLILVFLEENICQLILSKPERQMKKGTGFHFDIVLSCFINIISGLFGAPFMGPACVRTVSHTSALTVMSSGNAPGESPKIVGVKEQRMSSFVVSVLVGVSVFLTAALTLVPKPVLFGIFLYMGISATAGIQFLERLVLFLMPVKHHPNVPYVKKLKTMKMHIFTGVQLIMLIVLWVVKQSPAALCFPFVLMLLVPIRLFLLPYIFNNQELSALDGTEGSNSSANEEHEPDFYEETHELGTHVDHQHQN